MVFTVPLREPELVLDLTDIYVFYVFSGLLYQVSALQREHPTDRHLSRGFQLLRNPIATSRLG
jgi:hypothetical protein